MIREMFAKMTLDHPLTPRYDGKNVFLFGSEYYVAQLFRPKFHDYQLPIAGLSSTHNVDIFPTVQWASKYKRVCIPSAGRYL